MGGQKGVGGMGRNRKGVGVVWGVGRVWGGAHLNDSDAHAHAQNDA